MASVIIKIFGKVKLVNIYWGGGRNVKIMKTWEGIENKAEAGLKRGLFENHYSEDEFT